MAEPMTVEKYEPGVMWNRPPRNPLEERKVKFAGLLGFVTERGGWLTSVPGGRVVDLQCLPGSELPDQIASLGYRNIKRDGTSQRILPHAISETVLIEGSTRAEVRHHAGLTPVECWTFTI